MARMLLTIFSAVAVMLGAATIASAEQLGTFSWQLQPYCNVLTLNVTVEDGVFMLDGVDDQCGAATRASAAGVAFPNPNGTFGLGIVILDSPGGAPFYVEATVTLPSASGTWREKSGIGGTFAFNAATGGSPRPSTGASVISTQFGGTARIEARSSRGTLTTPLASTQGDVVGIFSGTGYTGLGFAAPSGAMTVTATEDWTAAARGAQLNFWSTANGTGNALPRMTIDPDGQVGIGTLDPQELLHVTGAVRIGSCTYNPDGGVACFSDARFKQEITSLPDTLDRIVRLRPVQFSWRAAEYPEHGFAAEASTGLIAQDVEAVMPELVTTDAEGYKAVNYNKLPLLAIQAIKELKAENDALKQQLDAQRVDIERRLTALETSTPIIPR